MENIKQTQKDAKIWKNLKEEKGKDITLKHSNKGREEVFFCIFIHFIIWVAGVTVCY